MKTKLGLVAAVVAAFAGIPALAAAATSPAVVTGSTSKVSDTHVVLHGTVNPNGSSTTYYFQWGLTNGYGDNGKPVSAGAGSKAVAVTETATGLLPGTVYHYRLVATNGVGTSEGHDRTVKTAGHPPAQLETGPATDISTGGATLTGAINPVGAATQWYFQWGTSPSFSQETTPQTLPASATAQSVASSLQGVLHEGTLYYYRLVASRDGVVSDGATGSFLTYPDPRPVPGLTAMTRPGLARHRPYLLTTTGTLTAPSWMPAGYACAGNVTIRFFDGLRQVGFTLAGVQPNCTFSGQTRFQRTPGRGKVRKAAHLHVVIRYVATSYLASRRAAYEKVTLG
jgi:hypothetical protein